VSYSIQRSVRVRIIETPHVLFAGRVPERERPTRTVSDDELQKNGVKIVRSDSAVKFRKRDGLDLHVHADFSKITLRCQGNAVPDWKCVRQ
jgi:hypothetical protein